MRKLAFIMIIVLLALYSENAKSGKQFFMILPKEKQE